MILRLHTAAPLRAGLVWASWLFVPLGIAGVVAFVWSEADRRFAERHQLAEWEAIAFTPKPSPLGEPLVKPANRVAATARQAPETPDADVLARLEIPAVNLTAFVRHGVDAATLRRAVGHVPGTPLPGEPGNSALAAHRDTHFAALREIRRGDVIRIRRRGWRLAVEYRVDLLAVVEPSYAEALAPSATPRITLVTCYPFGYVGPSPRRFIVRRNRWTRHAAERQSICNRLGGSPSRRQTHQ